MTRHLVTHCVTCSGDKITIMIWIRLGLEVTCVGGVLQLAVSVVTRGGQGVAVLQTIRRGAGVAGKINISGHHLLLIM